MAVGYRLSAASSWQLCPAPSLWWLVADHRTTTRIAEDFPPPFQGGGEGEGRAHARRCALSASQTLRYFTLQHPFFDIRHSIAAIAIALLFLQACAKPQAEGFSVLVFSKTAGFRHESIPDGVVAIAQLGAENGFDVQATEDAAIFTDPLLGPFAAVVFLSTTGDILDDAQQAAFEQYVHRGGGFVGIHAASDTEYDWPWYGRLVGAYFHSHPEIQEAVIDVTDRDHPSTRCLPPRWTRRDEWYNYRRSPANVVHVLARLDERSYQGGNMGDDHPIAWCHELDGGRAWYTGGGHTSESFNEPLFLQHLLGGILWVAGKESDER